MRNSGTRGSFPFRSARDLPCIWHGARVEIALEDDPPFPVDALVVEDDTWQVLGADPEFRPTREHPIRLMHSLYEARPVEPGSVLVQEGVPVRLHAIVHDLDREPTWRIDWIAAALENVLQIAERRSLRALGLPQLGSRHGRLTPQCFLDTLDRALARKPIRFLSELWIIQHACVGVPGSLSERSSSTDPS